MNANEVPWGWYFTRAAGLMAFLLLYITIFLGLAVRTPVLRKIIKPFYSFSIHRWLSLQALTFVLIHSLSLLFDKFYTLSLRDIFIPFAFSSDTLNPLLVALGIIGFYLMVILVITSYGRRFMNQKLWRLIHSINITLYIIVIIHSFYLGTDLKIPLIRNIFIWLNAFLIFLFLVNIISRILSWRKRDLEA